MSYAMKTKQGFVAVDPGLHYCGVSMWDGGRLVRARLVVNSVNIPGALNALPMAQAVHDWVGPGAHGLVIEVPQIYPRSHSKGDPNDLIDLTAVAGAVIGCKVWSAVTIYRPAQWKGQAPKEVTTARAQEKLTAVELASISFPAAHLAHNVWDAVALGLSHLKKTGVR